MLQESAAPIIVAGGGIINADASDLLVELAETLGVPVVPTLMGWGAIPDDHLLMAGMAGLQTSQQYGNATLLASDFVFGIGNRWANRHTGGLDVYRRGRKFVHVDIEPTQIGRVFPPDYGIVSDAGAALRLLVEVAKERKAAGRLRDYTSWVEECAKRKGTMLRRTHFDNVPVKPQRVYEEMNKAFGRDTRYVSHDRAVADRRRPVPARLQAAALDQRRAGRSAGLDPAGRARGLRGRPGRHGGRAARRLRLPVHARGAGRRGPVQPALHPRPGEQLLPGADPPVAARFRDGLLRAAGLREHQQPGAGRLRRRPRQGGRGHGLQGVRVDAPGRPAPARSRRPRSSWPSSGCRWSSR